VVRILAFLDFRQNEVFFRGLRIDMIRLFPEEKIRMIL
jgi:hypothetical protein